MVVRFLQSRLRFVRGKEYDLPDGVANLYVRQNVAELVIPAAVQQARKQDHKQGKRR